VKNKKRYSKYTHFTFILGGQQEWRSQQGGGMTLDVDS